MWKPLHDDEKIIYFIFLNVAFISILKFCQITGNCTEDKDLLFDLVIGFISSDQLFYIESYQPHVALLM